MTHTFLIFPDEIKLEVLQYLSDEDLLRFTQTSRALRRLQPDAWAIIWQRDDSVSREIQQRYLERFVKEEDSKQKLPPLPRQWPAHLERIVQHPKSSVELRMLALTALLLISIHDFSRWEQTLKRLIMAGCADTPLLAVLLSKVAKHYHFTACYDQCYSLLQPRIVSSAINASDACLSYLDAAQMQAYFPVALADAQRYNFNMLPRLAPRITVGQQEKVVAVLNDWIQRNDPDLYCSAIFLLKKLAPTLSSAQREGLIERLFAALESHPEKSELLSIWKELAELEPYLSANQCETLFQRLLSFTPITEDYSSLLPDTARILALLTLRFTTLLGYEQSRQFFVPSLEHNENESIRQAMVTAWGRYLLFLGRERRSEGQLIVEQLKIDALATFIRLAKIDDSIRVREAAVTACGLLLRHLSANQRDEGIKFLLSLLASDHLLCEVAASGLEGLVPDLTSSQREEIMGLLKPLLSPVTEEYRLGAALELLEQLVPYLSHEQRQVMLLQQFELLSVNNPVEVRLASLKVLKQLIPYLTSQQCELVFAALPLLLRDQDEDVCQFAIKAAKKLVLGSSLPHPQKQALISKLASFEFLPFPCPWSIHTAMVKAVGNCAALLNSDQCKTALSTLVSLFRNGGSLAAAVPIIQALGQLASHLPVDQGKEAVTIFLSCLHHSDRSICESAAMALMTCLPTDGQATNNVWDELQCLTNAQSAVVVATDLYDTFKKAGYPRSLLAQLVTPPTEALRLFSVSSRPPLFPDDPTHTCDALRFNFR